MSLISPIRYICLIWLFLKWFFSPLSFCLPCLFDQIPSLKHMHALTTIWSNPNLHPEKPFPWWLTNLKPHPEGHSFSCFCIHLFCPCHIQTHDSPPVVTAHSPPLSPHWLLLAVNQTGEDDFGLRLWPHWLQVQRLGSSWTLVLGFGVYLV